MAIKLPKSKLLRGKTAGATALKVGLKHADYLKNKLLTKLDGQELLKEKYEKEIGALIYKNLAKLRGAALKVSQMLSIEADFLPEAVRKELARAFFQVKPLPFDELKEFVENELGEIESVFADFEYDAFAAASLGQVHKARGKKGEILAVKIQYPGIADSIESDIKILKTLMLSLSKISELIPKKEMINFVLSEIETRLKEEVDYEFEASMADAFKGYGDSSLITIPKVYKEYSSKHIISYEFLDGIHFSEWKEKGVSQEVRDKIGQTLFDFFWKGFLENNIIHADPHPGNFLIMPDGKLGILDFGCVLQVTDEFKEKLMESLKAQIDDYQNGNSQRIFKAYRDLKFVPLEMEYLEFEEKFKPLFSIYRDWFSPVYCVKSPFDFNKLERTYPTQDFSKIRQVSRTVSEVYREQIYFDRAYMGLLGLLKLLEAKIDTSHIFN